MQPYMINRITLLLFIGLAWGLLIIQSCSKDKIDTPEILNSKLDLIVNTKWHSNGISRFTHNDTTTYYGGIYILDNDSLIMTPVNSKTGETTPLIKKQYNLEAQSAAFDIANDLSEKIFNHLQKDKVKNSR